METKCKKCRREGEKLMLKGDRCFSPKCAVVTRPYIPGQHGPNSRIKLSEYGRQLREKQKIKRIYGLSESDMRKYYAMAEKSEGSTTENLISLIESRLDNAVFRTGLAPSRNASRQLVSHGKVQKNGRKITIPSYMVSPKEVFSFNFKIDENVESKSNWINVDLKKKVIEIKHIPSREEIELNVNESLVVEYYTR